MNKVILIGRLSQDPVLYATKSNISYARFTVAVKRENTTADITDFIPIVAWRNTATYVSKYILKGSLVAIEGSFNTNRYQNDKNQTVTSYDVTAERVTILESKAINDERRAKQGMTSNAPKMTFANDNLDYNSSNPQKNDFNFDYNVASTPKTPEVLENNENEDEWTFDDLLD